MAEKARKKLKKFTNLMQIKLMAIFALILIFLAILLGIVVYINFTSGSAYARKVLSQENYDSQTLKSRRGTIQDKNGRLLAYSEKHYNVVLDCLAVNEKKEYFEPTVNALVALYDLERGDIVDRLTSEKTKESQYQVLKNKITEEEKDAYSEYKSVKNHDTSHMTEEEVSALKRELSNVVGIYFEEVYVRRYPLHTVASSVIGFADEEVGGKDTYGLEKYYDSLLSGTDGRVFGYLNEYEEYEKQTIAPKNGYTLQLEMDLNIQEIVEKYILEFDETYGTDEDNGTAMHGAKNIGVIVSNPNDGGIFAMATNHAYDLEDHMNLSAWYTESQMNAMTDEEKAEARHEQWGNFCVQASFEPGSTFKPITIAAALESGAVSEADSFYCDGGEQVTDTYIRCDAYPGAHGAETLGDVLKNSCNDGLMAIGRQMGVPSFINAQRLFNFGQKTGIDIPYESVGSVYTRDTMNEVELATCTFGQGFTCTMVQEIAAFSAVVNGGYYYQPHVVDKVLDENGKVVKSDTGILLKQPISTRVSEVVRGYLETAVQEGTGSKAQVPGYRVGGKTGTAEKIDEVTHERADGKYLVSFIGAVPINDPQVVIYVVIDEPNVEDQAHSTYAQEIFRKIATEVLPYMGIYPTEEVTDAQLAALGLTHDDVPEDVVEYFQAFGSDGTLYNRAHISDGVVVDDNGQYIDGTWIDSDGTVYDAKANPVYKLPEEEEPDDPDPKVENPNIAAPPQGSTQGEGAVWDGTALEDPGDADGE